MVFDEHGAVAAPFFLARLHQIEATPPDPPWCPATQPQDVSKGDRPAIRVKCGSPMREPALRSSFGDLLRRYRTSAGFSQEELAQRANISLAAVSSLERGIRRAPQRHTVELLLNGLGLGAAARAELLEAALRSRARTRGPAVIGVSHGGKQLNCPLYLTSFVANDTEMTGLQTLIRGNRLVTIVGAGGIGKTRLACEVASRLSDEFDLIVFADLAPLIEGEMLIPYLAGVVSAENGGGAPIDAIVSAVNTKRVMLLLDNCEQLLEAAASAITALLRSCSTLKIVATSRERLSISGEWIHRLQPLEVPGEGPITLADAQRSPAVQLFVQRARAVEPNFTLREDDVADVLDICHHLDGIPLAIELAVARLPTLGVRQLRQRLGQQFASFTGNRDSPPRHQTMYATIAWSFDLLDVRERRLIERIGIFSGGFTLNAAELVCCDTAVEAPYIVDVLSRLVEKSLLLVSHEGNSSRYRLLEPVRLHSLERLHEADSFADIARRHAVWIADRADAANSEIARSLTDRSITTQMTLELGNIRAALEWLFGSKDAGDIVLAARIVGGLRSVWIRSFLFDEGARWSREIFARLDDDEQPELSALVMLLQIQSAPQPVDAQTVERAVRLFTRAGNYYALCNFYINFMQVTANIGDFDRASMACTEATRLFASEQVMKGPFYARFLSTHAHLLGLLGQFAEARVVDAAALTILEKEGAPQDHARRCELRKLIEAFAGNYAYAIRLANEALAIFSDGHSVNIESAYADLASYHFLDGDLDRAQSALRTALAAGRLHYLGFNVVAHVGAAMMARRGAFEAAARLKGFVDCHESARKGSFRNPVEIRLNETITAAFADRADGPEFERLMILGAQMSAADVRSLLRDL
jgi:predicted ATPase/DNA-binding XRE family transcriptional regulator